MDLEVARADRHLEPVAVAAGLAGTPARPATRRGRRSEACAAAAAGRRRAHAGRAPSRARSARAAAARPAGPGRTTTGVPSASTTSPGAVPASPSEIAPSGSVACLRTPSAKSAYGRFIRSATMREMPSICASSRSSTRSSQARDLRDDLDRAVVVGRPETAGADDEIGRGDARRAAPPRARAGRRRRSRSAPARVRARAASGRGTGRSGRCARRARARCP